MKNVSLIRHNVIAEEEKWRCGNILSGASQPTLNQHSRSRTLARFEHQLQNRVSDTHTDRLDRCVFASKQALYGYLLGLG